MEPTAAAQEAQWAQVAPPASFLHAAAAEMACRVTQYANNQVRLTHAHNSSTWHAMVCGELAECLHHRDRLDMLCNVHAVTAMNRVHNSCRSPSQDTHTKQPPRQRTASSGEAV